ncbi:MAG: NBR1-Ig-like domain-containing protein, partial [Anaerolineae bacterium]
MDFEQAERRFRQLQTQMERGEIDEVSYRVEVAKLLLRDAGGAFWMIDPESGTWFCNPGDGWQAADPHAGFEAETGRRARPPGAGPRRRRLWALSLSLLLLFAAVAATTILRWPPALWNLTPPTPSPVAAVEVVIASPAHEGVVALDQQVAVEATLRGRPDLGEVAHVELLAGDQPVSSQAVQPRIQAGQTSLPLAIPWRPTAVGEYELSVVALSAGGQTLGQATIQVQVAEAAAEALPEPACTPDATFVTDVTIAPGADFAPGSRLDKVWQVRNSGSCAWDVGYELVFIGGQDLGASSPAPVPPTAAGERANLEVIFWAPDEIGVYTSSWQLRTPQDTFFGPSLPLSIEVRALAPPGEPPAAPGDLQARVTEDGQAVHLTWQDRSGNEDGFRVYREDVEPSIGLVPADVQLFVDRSVACGSSYRYGVVAFNAAGSSSLSETPQVTLPPCAATDALPTLNLTVVPTRLLSSGVFTVTFEAEDDVGLAQVIVRGEETGDADLDAGRMFPC